MFMGRGLVGKWLGLPELFGRWVAARGKVRREELGWCCMCKEWSSLGVACADHTAAPQACSTPPAPAPAPLCCFHSRALPPGDEIFLFHQGYEAPGPYELFIASTPATNDREQQARAGAQRSQCFLGRNRRACELAA